MRKWKRSALAVDSIVTDPATAEALKPWYGYFCKRPCFHDDYLQTFNRNNVTLVDTRGRGVEAITAHGLAVRGFPNCFVLSIAQSGFTVNFPYLLEVQATHVARLIAWALARNAAELEATAEAEQAWVDTVVGRSAASVEKAKSCTPGYYNREGQATAKTRQGSFFYGTPTEYADILESSRANGSPEGLEIRDPGVSV